MHKRHRQQAILDVVSRQHIPNQSVLGRELEKLNFAVTQATISRDVTELNLMKTPSGYLCPQDKAEPEESLGLRPATTLRLSVERVDTVLNYVVVQTVRNSAQHVALVFDDPVFDEVVGTAADGDTVLVLTDSPEDAQRTKAKLMEFIH